MCRTVDIVYRQCSHRSPRRESCGTYRAWQAQRRSCLGALFTSSESPCRAQRLVKVLDRLCDDCQKSVGRHERHSEWQRHQNESWRAHKGHNYNPNLIAVGPSQRQQQQESRRDRERRAAPPSSLDPQRDSYVDPRLMGEVYGMPGSDWPSEMPRANQLEHERRRDPRSRILERVPETREASYDSGNGSSQCHMPRAPDRAAQRGGVNRGRQTKRGPPPQNRIVYHHRPVSPISVSDFNYPVRPVSPMSEYGRR